MSWRVAKLVVEVGGLGWPTLVQPRVYGPDVAVGVRGVAAS